MDQIKYIEPSVDPAPVGESADGLRLRWGMQVNVTEDGFSTRLREVHEAGFRYVELKFKHREGLGDRTDDQVLERFKMMKDELSSLGMKVWSIHLPHNDENYTDLASLDENIRLQSVEFLGRVIRLVSVFGAKNIVTHPSKGAGNDREAAVRQSRKSLAALQEVASRYGMRLCVENLITSLGHDPREIDALVRDIPGIRLTFDIGHANIRCHRPETGCANVVDFVAGFGERLATIHVHDNKSEHDTHSLVGEGKVALWGEFYRCLLETNRYRGVFMFEPSERDAAADVMATTKVILEAYEALGQ